MTESRGSTAADRVREAITIAGRGLVERQSLLELVALAAVAEEHVLIVGPPGTAKSEAVRRIARAFGGTTFEYLLGRFTEPSEIFGPVDLRKLREGSVETETRGMLPEADIAFLDEVFLGSTAILNTLLGVLNERMFRRGHTAVRCPLRVCVGATNVIPEDEHLAAFADRFLVRVFVDPMGDPRLEDLLEGGWALASATRDPPSTELTKPVASLADLHTLCRAARAMDLSKTTPLLAHSVRLLRRAGIMLSDRRIVKLQSLVAAAASLGGRGQPTEADLWPIVAAVPTREAQGLARDVLKDVLTGSENESLSRAALETSLGPVARAREISKAAELLFEARPPSEATGEELDAWKLRLEGIARTIDAGFHPSKLPEELLALKTRITDVLHPA